MGHTNLVFQIFPSYFGPWRQEIEDSRNPDTEKLWERVLGDLAKWPCAPETTENGPECETGLLLEITRERKQGKAYVGPSMFAFGKLPGIDNTESGYRQRVCQAHSFEVPMGRQMVGGEIFQS